MDLPPGFVDAPPDPALIARRKAWQEAHPPGNRGRKPKAAETPVELVQAQLPFAELEEDNDEEWPFPPTGMPIPGRDETGPITDDPTVLRRFASHLLVSAIKEVAEHGKSDDPQDVRTTRLALEFLCYGRQDVKEAECIHTLAGAEFLLEHTPETLREKLAGCIRAGSTTAARKLAYA